MELDNQFIESQRTRYTSVLTQDEIDQLLTAVNDDTAPRPNFQGTSYTSAMRQRSKRDRYSSYNFKQPYKMRGAAVEAFGRQLVNDDVLRRLTALLKRVIYKDAAYDQCAWVDVCRSMPSPALVAIYEANDEEVMIAIDYVLCRCFLMSLFCQNTIEPRLKKVEWLTELEKRALFVVIEIVADRLSEVINTPLKLKHYDFDEVFLFDTKKALTMGIEAGIQIDAKVDEGVIHTFVPYGAFTNKVEDEGDVAIEEDIEVECRLMTSPMTYSVGELMTFNSRRQLSFDNNCVLMVEDRPFYKCTLKRRAKNEAIVEKLLWNKELQMTKEERVVQSLKEVDVTLSVEVGRKKLTLGELKKMKAGSIIELNTFIDNELNIYVNNALVGKGQILVSSDDLFTVKVTEFVTTDDILDD